MKTASRKRQRGGVMFGGKRAKADHDERYWDRLREQFRTGTYPNSGAYAQVRSSEPPSFWRELGARLERFR